MIRFLGWVARRRVAVLAGSLLVAVASVVLRSAVGNADVQLLISMGTLLLSLVLVMVSMLSVQSFRPATLVARPELPAFEVPPNPGVVLFAAGYTCLIVMWLDDLVRDVVAGEDLWFSAIFIVIFIGGLAVQWRLTLSQFSVRLQPDGIVDRQVSGSLFIPWEALATPYPAFAYDRDRVTLFLAQPELIRRSGRRRAGADTLPAVSVNAELLARAIHEYANRPGRRALIGSEAELTRFLTIPQLVALR